MWDAGNDGRIIYTLVKKTKEDLSMTQLEQPPRVLIVDDNEDVRAVLTHYLKKLSVSSFQVDSGTKVLAFLEKQSVDLILLDIMMPGITGIDVLKLLKEAPAFAQIPVMMCSAIDQTTEIVKCLRLGAEDYIPKPFDRHILQARVNGCLLRKQLRDRERAVLEQLNQELDDARDYIHSRLPPPTQEPVQINWEFVASSALGGDGFGYHWLDDSHFALYLLDVSGHGVGSALLATSVSDFLNHARLPIATLCNPTEVAHHLNVQFKLEDRAGKYFTIWYGVYHHPTRKLSYTSAGHPPALLVRDKEMQQLGVGSIAITGMEDDVHPTETVQMAEGDQLLIFSDGAYEVEIDGVFKGYQDFVDLLGGATEPLTTPNIMTLLQTHHQKTEFDDDISIMDIRF